MSIFGLIEKVTAVSQGKGYGSHSTKAEVARAAKLLGRRPDLAVDVGGNKGEYTSSLLSENTQIEVHVFEPSATNVKHLKERFSENEKVVINDYGLGSIDRSGVLYSDTAGSGLASLTKRNLEHLGVEFEYSEPIQVRRFDSYWQETLNCRHIDIVKIDVEGHELEVLSGFGNAINHIDILQFEFGGCNIDTRSFFRDFWHFFSTHHFDLFRITPFGVNAVKHYSEKDECFVTTNYLARRRV